MTGTMAVKQTFQNGNVYDGGSDPDSDITYNTTQESSHTIPVEIVVS